MKQAKTNAMRFLEKQNITYTAHEYDPADGRIDGVSVAAKTGQDPAHVFKTLVTRGSDGGVYVFCLPVGSELPLKAAARAAGVKSIVMLPPGDITSVTGYVRGGCSPLGMKKRYPTFLHESSLAHDTIFVSGGRVGLQIEIAPGDLLTACSASPFAG